MGSSTLIISLAVILVVTIASVNGLDGNGERCTITEGSGITVDSCDGSKYLACSGGRCQCPDTVNQVYTYRYENERSRSRRSPKKGGGGKSSGSGFKKVVGGAAIGAGGAYVGYKVGKAVANSGDSDSNYNNNNNNNYRNRNNNNDRNQGKKIYSCYGRVGAQCNLNYNQFNIVSTSTTTSTSTVTPSSVSTSTSSSVTEATNINATTESTATTTAEVSSSSSTTAAPLPVPAAQISQPPRHPTCVAHAECKSKSSLESSGNNTHVVKITLDSDPRIGVCQCNDGYEHRKTDDLCVPKSASSTLTSSFMILIGLFLLNKIYCH